MASAAGTSQPVCRDNRGRRLRNPWLTACMGLPWAGLSLPTPATMMLPVRFHWPVGGGNFLGAEQAGREASFVSARVDSNSALMASLLGVLWQFHGIMAWCKVRDGSLQRKQTLFLLPLLCRRYAMLPAAMVAYRYSPGESSRLPAAKWESPAKNFHQRYCRGMRV